MKVTIISELCSNESSLSLFQAHAVVADNQNVFIENLSQPDILRLLSVITAITVPLWSGETGILSPVQTMRSMVTCKAMD